MKKRLHVGLDVHKENIVIALAFADKPEVVTYGKVSSDLESFLKALRKLQAKYGLEKEDLALCYEAGPTGFVLARRLLGLGYEIIVVAPSLIPQKAGERVKTDRRDARKLADLFRAGLLTAVHIPCVEDEVLRDVCRARTDAVDVRSRARQQLGALLLRNGYHYTETTNWTQAHMRYLRELVMPNPAQKLVLEEYLQSVDAADEKVNRFEQQMLLMQQAWSRRDFSLALQGFRGFDLVAALTITSELGDITRFVHPRALMAYLGLVPSETSSGSSRRQGAITKCGNSHVRWMLVEVAHAYRLPPKISAQLSHRQENLSREVKAIAWRAQNRLNRRYTRLKMRRLHENKIKVAIARELIGFLWELGQFIAGRPTTPRKPSAPKRASGVKAA